MSLSSTDEVAPPELSQPARSSISTHERVKRRRLVVVGAVLLIAVAFLLYKTLSSAIVYFKTASQAVAERSALANSTFQIEGDVVPGTIREHGTVVDFSISSGRATVPVQNIGSPPQLFQAGVPVVLVGHFIGATNDFSSDQILIKHSNAYIAAHPKRVEGLNHKVVH